VRWGIQSSWLAFDAGRFVSAALREGFLPATSRLGFGLASEGGARVRGFAGLLPGLEALALGRRRRRCGGLAGGALRGFVQGRSACDEERCP
jgi:hypothetical protein